ncbi:isopropylmalate isomerase [Roseovarius sp. M141]|uniref:isopropylmalate isomerase n=1 Tax=Roseovarius sp. M141 TaxID=2583806 RepID=UPI0020CDE407|nr:isopropylmalate isomerase [Roseovarius sp. M141]MCQ0090467.1 isopropylmalate isomerase [Roseovarius sp. M141]
MTEIWACTRQDWQIGIGDPGPMGWLIVVLYLVTAGLALCVAGRGGFPERTQSRERLFWCLLAGILLLLAVNKQLDLQSLLTAVARCLAQIQGWYEERRAVQIGFIIWIVVVMVIFFSVIWILLHKTLRRNGLALVGLIFVLGFVAIRAAGFHHMDRLIDMRISSVRLNWIFEMTGPALILISGLSILRAARGKRSGGQ